jgi:hypothetical protein
MMALLPRISKSFGKGKELLFREYTSKRQVGLDASKKSGECEDSV